MKNSIHFVLQAKGGIGKSFISTLLAQHLINETGAVRCFDTDQENTTFAHYEALAVRHVAVADQSRLIDPKKFDALMETLLTEEGNFVIDTGANTFSNLLAYMIENEVFPLLKDAGKTVYVHTIVGGGDTLADTANGFYAIAQKVNGTRVVVWFNEHFGEIKTAEGKPFIETQAYKQSASKLTGSVTLFKRNAATYGADIRKLNTQRHTISQALASSDYTLMEKQRIKTFGRDVFDQLRALAW
ncbi:hypothetical protein PG1C_09475 [Rugosibacter aromaticivorans]|jgi:hypothetical protein|uniref:Conjugal transfer protein TraL n=1 Tax=Rugosibacter aromaticivorans TaxID=1565605 RepID=A0A0C5J9M5_9PROT|nr:hypothetical protein [Rugosibacter aromaticivorans]AJP48610.1 hypothetical protein PG1C_09475 [Rugosibacter aromaticivorans]TBR12640.1 MAG: hypothetical protein EPO43_13210 [Rugosibacter sp.]